MTKRFCSPTSTSTFANQHLSPWPTASMPRKTDKSTPPPILSPLPLCSRPHPTPQTMANPLATVETAGPSCCCCCPVWLGDGADSAANRESEITKPLVWKNALRCNAASQLETPRHHHQQFKHQYTISQKKQSLLNAALGNTSTLKLDEFAAMQTASDLNLLSYSSIQV